jgi:hypothetical protein
MIAAVALAVVSDNDPSRFDAPFGAAPVEAGSDADDLRPCIVQPDCGGGALVVAAAVLPPLLAVTRLFSPAGRLATPPRRLRSVLLAQGPDQPPRSLL